MKISTNNQIVIGWLGYLWDIKNCLVLVQNLILVNARPVQWKHDHFA